MATTTAKIRPYAPGDELGIRELFAAVHARELPAELWRWRYLDNPCGRAAMTVAEIGGRIAAHVGTLPVDLSRGGETLRGGLWVDLMTHPAHRGLDLFLDLAEAHRRQAASEGVRLLFAFPNEKSHPILQRMLDWTPIEEIDALEGPAASFKARTPKGWTVQRVRRFDEGFDALWGALKPKTAIVGSRGSRLLAWRYGAKPGSDYAVWAASGPDGRRAGWLAAKTFDAGGSRIGDILDLWAGGADAAAALAAEAAAWFAERGVATVSAWALKGSALRTSYRAWGLEPAGPRTHFAGRWSSVGESAAFPAAGTSWSVSKGDSDVF